ncbi:sensor histidine kinase [Sulfoacidibacillus thermotolerans]|uniref:histidine kinase n=1 Tax=Sulfoacidibacillus thermotolerans TaxID=1765684 RepID=A0A2U3D9R8_SULT2|nr:HAMP domain-containing sensor histidine kinase [Sulfoacidibacillus thermotolerans]PWI58029.1 hypothetical protein BM613_04965 [Sulfoacidibacillus thermotolerans]
MSNWLIARERLSILTQAKQIAAAYSNNIQEGKGEQNFRWLQAYLAKDQGVELINRQGIRITSLTIPQSINFGLQVGPLREGASIISIQGHSYIRTVYPSVSEGKRLLGWVILYSSVDTVFAYINTLIQILLLSSFGAIALAGISGYAVAWTALGPLDRIIQSIRKVDPNRLSYRLPELHNTKEIAELTESFNKMLERIEFTMERQNQFIEDASHELRSPLTVIEGYVNLLDRWGKSDQAVMERALLAIKKESSRLRHLTNDLLQLASLQTLTVPAPIIEIGEVIQDVISNIEVAYQHPIISVGCEQKASIAMHAEHLQQLLMIFLDNAVKHTTKEDRIFIKLRVTTTSVIITVQDEGNGIPKENLPHIFERFYRVDSSRDRKKGAGLGLAIAKEMVDLYKGSLTVSSTVDKGTEISVQFKRY